MKLRRPNVELEWPVGVLHNSLGNIWSRKNEKQGWKIQNNWVSTTGGIISNFNVAGVVAILWEIDKIRRLFVE